MIGMNDKEIGRIRELSKLPETLPLHLFTAMTISPFQVQKKGRVAITCVAAH